MIKRLLSAIILLSAYSASAQGNFYGQDFYNPGGKRIYKINIQKDTIYSYNYRYDKMPPDPDTRNKIYLLRQQGGFTVFCTMTEHNQSILGSPIGNTYEVGAYKLSEDEKKLSVAYETTSHQSVDECKNLDFDPSTRFTITFYSKAYYDQFKNFKQVKDLDSIAVNNIFDELKKQILASKTLLEHSSVSMYGTLETQEVLNRTLIALHINPVISAEEFDYYTTAYFKKYFKK